MMTPPIVKITRLTISLVIDDKTKVISKMKTNKVNHLNLLR